MKLFVQTDNDFKIYWHLFFIYPFVIILLHYTAFKLRFYEFYLIYNRSGLPSSCVLQCEPFACNCWVDNFWLCQCAARGSWTLNNGSEHIRMHKSVPIFMTWLSFKGALWWFSTELPLNWGNNKRQINIKNCSNQSSRGLNILTFIPCNE